MGEEVNWGKDEFEEVAPLTAQEKQILKEFLSDVEAKAEEYNNWTKTIDSKVPNRRIQFEVTLSGETLKKLMFLRKVLIEGMKVCTPGAFVKRVVEDGINLSYDHYINSQLVYAAKMIQISKLPPELAQSIMTDDLRKTVKEIVAAVNDGTLAAMMETNQPQHNAIQHTKECQKGSPKKKNTSAAPVPVGTVCQKCHCNLVAGQAFMVKDAPYCADCAIEVGRSST